MTSFAVENPNRTLSTPERAKEFRTHKCIPQVHTPGAYPKCTPQVHTSGAYPEAL